MDERDADIFVDPAARCRRLARNIADHAAKRKLTGGGIRDDGGLAEGRKENRGAVERDERGSRSGTLATAFGGPASEPSAAFTDENTVLSSQSGFACNAIV
jgi:hypothetical protein